MTLGMRIPVTRADRAADPYFYVPVDIPAGTTRIDVTMRRRVIFMTWQASRSAGRSATRSMWRADKPSPFLLGLRIVAPENPVMVGMVLEAPFADRTGHDVQVIHLVAIGRAAGVVALRHQNEIVVGNRHRLVQ